MSSEKGKMKATNHTEIMRAFLSNIEGLEGQLEAMSRSLTEHKDKSLNEKWANFNERAANQAFFVAECKECDRTVCGRRSKPEIEASFKQKNEDLKFGLAANNLIIDKEIQQMFAAHVAFGAMLHKWALLHTELKAYEP
jgi:hypothetical protein